MTSQWQYNQGRWPEANTREQDRQWPDGLLHLYDVNRTDNNQPWKERPALAGIPTRVHPRFQDLRFNQCRHLVAAQALVKA